MAAWRAACLMKKKEKKKNHTSFVASQTTSNHATRLSKRVLCSILNNRSLVLLTRAAGPGGGPYRRRARWRAGHPRDVSGREVVGGLGGVQRRGGGCQFSRGRGRTPTRVTHTRSRPTAQLNPSRLVRFVLSHHSPLTCVPVLYDQIAITLIRVPVLYRTTSDGAYTTRLYHS